MNVESDKLPSSLSRNGGRIASLIVMFIMAICFIVTEAIRSDTQVFPIIGGGIGAVSSLFVMVSHLSSSNKSGSTMVLLFWRAFGDFGLAVRFLATNGFNIMVCGQLDCSIQSNLSSQSNCGFASFMLQFFEMASEGWFLCSGLDLYFSITQPFSNFKSRLPYYHLFVWTYAFVYALPTVIDDRIYGYWYINEKVTDNAVCWLQVNSSDTNINYIPFIMLYIPIVVIYGICSAILVKSYLRLRQGIPLTIIHRMKVLISNSINISICIATRYCGSYIAWDNYEDSVATLLFQGALYVLSAKGVTSILVYITIMNIKLSASETIYTSSSNTSNLSPNNLNGDRRQSSSASSSGKLDSNDERLDLNNALRQEILHFATTGIRCSAKESETMSTIQSYTNLKISQDSTPISSNTSRNVNPGSLNIDGTTNPPENIENKQITLLFFIKLVFGFRQEVMAINNMVQNTTRNYSSTSTVHVIKRVSVESSSNHSIGTSNTTRLSQRVTVLTGAKQQSRPTSITDHSIALGPVSNDIGVRSSMAIINLDDNAPPIDNNRSDSVVYEKQDDNQNPTILNNIRNSFYWLVGKVQETNYVEFTEFEPYYFRKVRLAAGVTDEDYIDAFKTTIKERLNDGGASGAFFFYSKDEVFLAKSCTEAELDCIRTSAMNFANYLEKNHGSYICRIYGAYRLRIYNTSLYFFVMNNIFLNNERAVINEKYDIKGSWIARNATPPRDGQIVNCKNCEQKFIYHRNYNRKLRSLSKQSNTALKSDSEKTSSLVGKLSSIFRIRGSSNLSSNESNIANQTIAEIENNENRCPYTVNENHEPNITLKDNDLKYKIRLPSDTALGLLNQLRKDAEFLFSIGVMDFSLLVGVHNTEYEVNPDDNIETISSSVSNDSINSLNQGNDSILLPSPIRPLSSSIAQPHANSSFVDSDFEHNDALGNSNDSDTIRTVHSPLVSGRMTRLKSVKGGFNLPKPNRSSLSEVRVSKRSQTRRLQVSRVVGPEAYYLGIIDYQQKWNFKKKLERFFKIHFKGADPDGLSAIEPAIYKDRFIRHIEDILDLDESNKVISRNNTSDNVEYV